MAGVRPSAQAKNVYELFAGKVFRVPDYQRNYAWEKKNWEDFWNDIKEWGAPQCLNINIAK